MIAAAGLAITLALGIAYVATLKLSPNENYAGPWQTLLTSLDALSSYPGSLVVQMRVPWLFATILTITGTLVVAVPYLRRTGIIGANRRSLMICLATSVPWGWSQWQLAMAEAPAPNSAEGLNSKRAEQTLAIRQVQQAQAALQQSG